MSSQPVDEDNPPCTIVADRKRYLDWFDAVIKQQEARENAAAAAKAPAAAPAPAKAPAAGAKVPDTSGPGDAKHTPPAKGDTAKDGAKRVWRLSDDRKAAFVTAVNTMGKEKADPPLQPGEVEAFRSKAGRLFFSLGERLAASTSKLDDEKKRLEKMIETLRLDLTTLSASETKLKSEAQKAAEGKSEAIVQAQIATRKAATVSGKLDDCTADLQRVADENTRLKRRIHTAEQLQTISDDSVKSYQKNVTDFTNAMATLRSDHATETAQLRARIAALDEHILRTEAYLKEEKVAKDTVTTELRAALQERNDCRKTLEGYSKELMEYIDSIAEAFDHDAGLFEHPIRSWIRGAVRCYIQPPYRTQEAVKAIVQAETVLSAVEKTIPPAILPKTAPAIMASDRADRREALVAKFGGLLVSAADAKNQMDTGGSAQTKQEAPGWMSWFAQGVMPKVASWVRKTRT